MFYIDLICNEWFQMKDYNYVFKNIKCILNNFN